VDTFNRLVRQKVKLPIGFHLTFLINKKSAWRQESATLLKGS